MGWEVRHGGKWYLYCCRRVNGKPVKEYLAAEGPWGAVMAHDLHRLQRHRAEAKRLLRKDAERSQERFDGLLAAVSVANVKLRGVAGGVLYALGMQKHKRGEWRMRRELMGLKALIDQLKDPPAGPRPLVKYDAPADDAVADGLIARVALSTAALGRATRWSTAAGVARTSPRPITASGLRHRASLTSAPPTRPTHLTRLTLRVGARQSGSKARPKPIHRRATRRHHQHAPT